MGRQLHADAFIAPSLIAVDCFRNAVGLFAYFLTNLVKVFITTANQRPNLRGRHASGNRIFL